MTDSTDNPRVTLEAPPRVRRGDTATLVVSVENVGEAPVDLYLRGRAPTLDLVVTNDAGERVFHLLQDAAIPAVVQIRTLRPGERLEQSLRWAARDASGRALEPGQYTLHALLLREDAPLEVERQILVE